VSARPPGFTLLEICLALAIIATVILLIVPSVSGLLAEQRLKESYERLNRVVAATANRSATEQRAYALIWGRQGVQAVPLQGQINSDPPSDQLAWGKDESFELQLPASLASHAKSRWVFWSNGICEPAIVTFHGPAGDWAVRYDPLTARGLFLYSHIR